MQTPENDTISAIITPPGTGGIAVIRLSGPAAIQITDDIFRGNVKLSKAPSHTVHFGRIENRAGAPIDEVLVTVFRAPHSYTAEDVVEISCHGSAYVAGRILELVVAGGSRTAGPGEFTKRAFLNGRIDLSQAEAVADLINADSAASHDLAIAQLRGTLSGKIAALRQRIVDLCSSLELELDFSDEGLEFVKRDELREALNAITRDITHLIDSFELGKIYKEGLRVVLAGSPNVGKSSILNALVREDRAIVTSISGTTRDTIEEAISIGGLRFILVDTAGLRSTHDIVEVEGIRRAREQIQHADLILFIIDPTQDIEPQLDAAIELIGGQNDRPKSIILVINKADLCSPVVLKDLQMRLAPQHPMVTAAITGIGIAELEEAVSERFLNTPRGSSGETILVSNLRQKESLRNTLVSLKIVSEGVDSGVTPDLLALDLRVALTHLSHFVGIDVSEEVLNNIFSKFCIGK